MLHIKVAQKEALSEARLLDALVDHVRTHHAEDIEGLNDATVRARVAEARVRADQYGLGRAQCLAFFVASTFVLGPRFDEEPAIRDVLTRHDLEPEDRIIRLLQSLTEQDWSRAKNRGH